MKRELMFAIGDKALAEQIACLLRKAFYRMASRYAIIGVSINNLGMYDNIPASTTTVLNAAVPFSAADICISEDLLQNEEVVRCYDYGEYPIYELVFNFTQQSITLNDFAPFIKVEKNQEIVNLTEPQHIEIKLYITEVERVVPESITEAILDDIPDKHTIIPLPADNHFGKFEFHIQGDVGKEHLFVTISAPDEKGINKTLENFKTLATLLIPVD